MPSDNTNQKHPTVMVVDDTPGDLQLLLQLLLQNGYHVSAFTDGRQALKAAKNDPPILFLLDIRMPTIDGFELCRLIKADDDLRDIPVLFISIVDGSEEIVRAFAVGGSDYVTKPFKPEVVMARVETHIRLHRLARENEAKIADIEKQVRKRTRQLEQKNEDLAKYAHQLEQANIALDVLIKKHESEGLAVVQAVIDELWRDISPMLAELEHLCTTEDQQVVIEMIQHRLADAKPNIPRIQDKIHGVLSRREHEVMLHVCEGRSCKEVARLLGIALRSVHSHCYSIRRKLNVPSKFTLKTWLAKKEKELRTLHQADQP